MSVARCTLVAACAAVWAVAASPALGADDRPVRPIGAQGALGNERLSDEQVLSRFAEPVVLATVRAKPSSGSRSIARLHYLTEDGPYEVYVVLESSRDKRGHSWLRIRVPGRPNGRTGWVVRDAFGPLRVVHTMLRVDRHALRATLYRDGRSVWTARVGVGASSTPTPAGVFWIRTRLRGIGSNGAYGPYAFGTADYSVLSDWPGGGVIGIHGTDEPSLIPGRPSHGCIRVRNAAIRRLWRLMPVGTPVHIV